MTHRAHASMTQEEREVGWPGGPSWAYAPRRGGGLRRGEKRKKERVGPGRFSGGKGKVKRKEFLFYSFFFFKAQTHSNEFKQNLNSANIKNASAWNATSNVSKPYICFKFFKSLIFPTLVMSTWK